MTELLELFRTFAASAPYAELRRATIVGCEVPFTMPCDGERLWAMGYGSGRVKPDSSLSPIAYGPSPAPCVIEGVIDLIYRLDGQMWVADYKTDRLRDDEVAGRAADYNLQALVYVEAVSRCIGVEKVGFKFLFLRNGLAVQV